MTEPEKTRLSIDVPYYVHPEVLEIGAIVYDTFDPMRRRSAWSALSQR